MENSLLRTGWFVAGVLAALFVGSCVVYWDAVTIGSEVGLVDLAELAVAMFLAMYIPFAVERIVAKQKVRRELLITQTQDIVAGLRVVNEVLTNCATRGITTEQDRMQIRARFLTSNVKVGRLEARLKKECGTSCKSHIDLFRKAYDKYYDSVTGGTLYGGGDVTWLLWRQQEFAFVGMEGSGVDLVRYLSTET